MIWQNKEITPTQRNRRTIAVITLIVVICIFYFVFAVVAIQHQLFIGYILRPPGVDCDRHADHHSDQQLANMAFAEDEVMDAASAAMDPFGSGIFPDLNG